VRLVRSLHEGPSVARQVSNRLEASGGVVVCALAGGAERASAVAKRRRVQIEAVFMLQGGLGLERARSDPFEGPWFEFWNRRVLSTG